MTHHYHQTILLMLERLLKLPENRSLLLQMQCESGHLYMHAMFWNPQKSWSAHIKEILRMVCLHVFRSRPDSEIGLGEKLIIVFMQHVRTINDDGRSISRDLDGFPVTCSGSYEDNMVVLKQESQFAKANDCSFSRFSLQIEQGILVLSRWLIFNRFKFTASKGVKLGPAFLLTR
ncbi:hypothetical protein LOK49_LG11G00868 [Camellia lanceoleosa]|uniref:Uncharacterized protein n=1 Tax=Camellia lanceoleosa TaxID=1840588 RepID=A0ACC0G4Y2_9ERIC|nr:hypothetical protein LOK49_LG11G00868 [Camellia lanceoleosa]